jgi:chloride channel protein, CIC family
VNRHEIERASTTPGLPVAPTLGPTLEAASLRPRPLLADRRVVVISLLAVGVAVLASATAIALTTLIAGVTNLAFYGRLSIAPASPAGNGLGALVVGIPILGGLLVGLLARFGSEKIRGHGIPEAMEQVLLNQSRVPPRLTFLKPLSAAIAIGTGGPFGAEGPIIATGGALGSLVGQLLHTTSAERKTLLAAGAAAGMAATFGTPLAAVLLAVELLLFELRPRSLVPVAFAAATAMAVRLAYAGAAPFFPMPGLVPQGAVAIVTYVVIGALSGGASVLITRLVYAVEDGFARLPLHWMWWPALGGLVVGLVGVVAPHTLGVGYDNIADLVSGRLVVGAAVALFAWKLLSWTTALGSGTSGGTLAPLFTIGGGLGAALGAAAAYAFPEAGVDPRIAALVGMAALFAGASRAVLASVVFAFETTLAPFAILPLLGGCTAAFLVSCLAMRNSIMTEKIARRGVRVPAEYAADYLDQVLVRDAASKPVCTVQADMSAGELLAWLESGASGTQHQGFPVCDAAGRLVGVVTRRDLARSRDPAARVADLATAPVVSISEDGTLREAADLMTLAGVGRLPVVARGDAGRTIGILTRSDLLSAHLRRLEEAHALRRGLDLFRKARSA